MLERLNLPKMALCATLINVMKLTKGVPLFAFAPLIFAQTSQSVAPGSVRPEMDGGRGRTRTCDLLRVKQAL
jgi:hypothetical protein